jgi:hypothetical protein
MHAKARCYHLDRIVADMAETVLDRLDNIHEAAAVSPKSLDVAFYDIFVIRVEPDTFTTTGP